MTEMCTEIRDTIALEGKAPENANYQKHLSECSECARFLKSVLAVEEELGALATDDVGDFVVDALLARPELTRTGRSHKLQWAMGLAAAAAIAFVAARLTLNARSFLPPNAAATTEVESFEVGGGKRGGGSGGGVAGEREGEELSDDEARALRSLGYIAGPPAEISPADPADPLEDRNRELDRRAYVEPLESKNEAPKKDSDAQVAQSPQREIAGGRVDAPVAQLEPPPAGLEETIVVTGESPAVDTVAEGSGSIAFNKARI
jgi:hypothetical protein